MKKLHRRFSPLTLLILSINGMIGSAWLFAPLYAAKIAGPAALVSWLIAGFATAIIALTFAELSVMFPVAGGTAQIPQISHGSLTSFILSWTAWLSALTMAPIEVQAIIQYASIYFPSLTYLKNGVPLLTLNGFFWATILMLTFCILNIVSYKSLVRSNFFIFIFKISIILIAIVAIIHTAFHPQNFNTISNTMGHASGWQSILTAVAAGGIAFAFTGFKHGVELAGETKQSSFAIPLGIVGSVFGSLLLYLGLQIAFIGALSPDTIGQGWQHLSFVGDVGPFAGLATMLGLFWLVKLLYIDATISPGGAGLIYVTSTARLLYAMSKIGYVPKWLTYVNKQHLPVSAIFVNFALGIFLFLPLPGWQAMVSFLVSGMVISYAIGPIALLCLRKMMPERERKFRLPAAPLLCGLAFYFCNLLSYWTGWDTIYKLSIAICIGLIFFILALWRGHLQGKQNLGLKSINWLLPYFVGLALISYFGAFGGKNIIPFGWDFLVIAIFSMFILYLALHNRTLLINESEHAFLKEQLT